MLSAQPIRPSAPTALPIFQSVSRFHAFGGAADAAMSMAVPHTTTSAALIDFIVCLVTFSIHGLLNFASRVSGINDPGVQELQAAETQQVVAQT